MSTTKPAPEARRPLIANHRVGEFGRRLLDGMVMRKNAERVRLIAKTGGRERAVDKASKEKMIELRIPLGRSLPLTVWTLDDASEEDVVLERLSFLLVDLGWHLGSVSQDVVCAGTRTELSTERLKKGARAGSAR